MHAAIADTHEHVRLIRWSNHARLFPNRSRQMIPIRQLKNFDFNSIAVDSTWNSGSERESPLHRIHAYPAKFPAFLTSKVLEYARTEGIHVRKMADVFCGCGTVALESRRQGVSFWGCDINPVATMIARVKSHRFQSQRLQRRFDDVVAQFKRTRLRPKYSRAPERLKYWYPESNYCELFRLRHAIRKACHNSSLYRDFFLCAFSNILKPTSRWLTKSIKPQVDPSKLPASPFNAFEDQCLAMIRANQGNETPNVASSQIVTANFLDDSLERPTVDVILTSPPYVTSYEYADLHQLSTLWLEFAQDYRDLRCGTIGSLHHDFSFDRELKRLNNTGLEIVCRLMGKCSHYRQIAKYFLDMQRAAARSHDMLSNGGMAAFVIGNTKYRGVEVNNARHLAESLLTAGFSSVSVTKRRISRKILTPFRDTKGRFSANDTGRQTYGEEYILVGRK